MRVRRATIALLVLACAACNDVRQFRGAWSGPRVGDAPVLDVGIGSDATATLTIDTIDTHGFAGHLTIPGLVDAAAITSLPGAEADVLSEISFTGSPLRVYLAFADASDGAGQLFVVTALYDDHRIEVRVLRGGTAPVYAIFALAEGP